MDEAEQPAVIRILNHIIAHPAFLMVFGIMTIWLSVGLTASVFFALNPSPAQTEGFESGLGVAVALVSAMAYLLFVLFVERKPLTDFEAEGALREWAWGLAIGAGAMTAIIAVIAAFGGYSVTGSNGLWVVVPLFGMAMQSGIMEEILFRGILFRFAEQWLGSIFALFISALLFGLVHLGNPNASLFAGLAIAIEAGILLGAVYMITRRLWAVIGLHMAWNVTQGGIFGIKVSGTDIPGFLISKTDGPALLTGGAFGAEASLPALIIATALGLYFLRKAWQQGEFVHPSWHRFKTGAAAPNAA
ncbi:CPBP family intramembrane glutamic endopeptidase [Sphingorhabdus arenilitoris]|uniref:CPBP family intramembrane glutamic endopeptidase n=1 Tax=Sphingorhabdus arenilitoris TaxID=1490041 RepID=A0ABV8RGP2_9SPHN